MSLRRDGGWKRARERESEREVQTEREMTKTQPKITTLQDRQTGQRSCCHLGPNWMFNSHAQKKPVLIKNCPKSPDYKQPTHHSIAKPFTWHRCKPNIVHFLHWFSFCLFITVFKWWMEYCRTWSQYLLKWNFASYHPAIVFHRRFHGWHIGCASL